MDNNSRTAKSIKNSGVALIFYVFSLLLQFFSRRILIDVLGNDVLGLNSTIQNILQFLNLAELGISSAVGFTLYKPLYNNDYKTVCEVVTLQGFLYRRIALLIIAGSIVVCSLFPLIFSQIMLPLWYAYASFLVLLLSALLGYFVNYKQIVLTASQQDYKVIFSYRSIMMLKVLLQMIAVYYLSHPYIWWLILEGLFSLIGSWSLHLVTKKTFPFLRSADESFSSLKLKYRELTQKTKQLFVHKIGRFALNQSAPLIIYAYANLSLVTYYSNYMVITNGVILLMSATFNSMTAGIGNLVAQEDQNKSISFFFELFNLRFLIISSVCFVLLYCTPGFITVWLGQGYNLPYSTLILIVSSLYITLSRMTVDAYVDVYGIFSDIYAPIIETILNIGLSILLGYYWGLNGILSGVLISQLVIILGWKPYFLFKKAFKINMSLYHWNYIKLLILATISGLCSWYTLNYIGFSSDQSLLEVIAEASLSLLLFSGILFLFMFLLRLRIDTTLKRFINRKK